MEKLIWEQNFLSKDRSLEQWNIAIGNDLLDENGVAIMPGWGNGEEQFYTGESSNLYFDEHGLNICARVEQVVHGGKTYSYTSARINTQHHFSYRYGRLIVRAKLPVGIGLWPAIWLLPQDQVYGPWPASGEIDIMEAKGRLPHQVSGTLHYGQSWDKKFTDEYTYQLPESRIDEFHNYELEWSKDNIRWLVDGHCYAERLLDHEQMPFDQSFYLLINVAVGGWYDRVEVDRDAFPAAMTIEGIWLYELEKGK